MSFSATLSVAVKARAAVSAENLRDKRIAVLQGNLGVNGALDVVRQYNTGLGVNVITQEGLANTPAMDAAMGAMVVDGP